MALSQDRSHLLIYWCIAMLGLMAVLYGVSYWLLKGTAH